MQIILKKTERFIFESPTWKFLTVLFSIMFFKTGIWGIPNLSVFQLLAQNPFEYTSSGYRQPYLFWNWLSVFLPWLFGAQKNLWSFFLFHLGFSVAFSFLFVKVVFRRFSSQVARTALVLFCLLPVSITSYFWVSYDSLTLFFIMMAFAYPNYLIVTILSGIAVGMEHFEQGFLGSVALLVAVYTNRQYDVKLKYSLKFCVVYCASIVLGKLGLVALFKYYSLNVPTRLFWGFQDVEYYLIPISEFLYHIHVCIWGVLGLGWLIALRYLDFRSQAIPFLKGFCIILLILPLSGDQTRVMAVSLFPLLTAYWLLSEKFLEKISKKEIAFMFLLWVMLPLDWVAGGKPKWSLFSYDIAQLLHSLFGWFNVSTDPWWPFF